MNDITTTDASQLPAHLAGLGTDLNADLSSGVSTGYPTISFKGKVWHVVQGDDRTLLTNDQGDPRGSIDVVILKSNPNLSKIYYEGGYQEGSNAKPTCYSNDSIAPGADAQKPQSTTCAACPHNAWGSRISESGAKGKACSDSRRVAVAPADDLEHPMLLRIPAGSLKDLTNYADMLNRRRAPYTAVVTRIGFDHEVAYQKLTFKAIRWVTESEVDTIKDVVQRSVVSNICGLSSPAAQPVAEPSPTPVSAAPAATPAPAQEEPDMFGQTSPAPPPVAAPAPEVTPAPVAAVVASADKTLEDALKMLDDDD